MLLRLSSLVLPAAGPAPSTPLCSPGSWVERGDPGKTPSSLDSSDMKWNKDASPGDPAWHFQVVTKLGVAADPQVSLEGLPENPVLAGWKEGDVVSGEGTGGSRNGGTVRGGPWRSRPVLQQLGQLRLPPISRTSENSSRKWSHSLTRTEISWEENHIRFLASGGCRAQTLCKGLGAQGEPGLPAGPAPGGRVLSVVLRLKPDLFTHVFICWGLTAAQQDAARLSHVNFCCGL